MRRSPAGALALATLTGLLTLLCACENPGPVDTPGPSDSGTEPPAPQLLLQLTSPTASVQQGAQREVTVQVTRAGGWSGDVSLSLESPPVGLSAEPLTVPAGVNEGTWRILAAPTAPVGGPFTLLVTARSEALGLESRSHLQLTVVRPPPGALDPTFGARGVLEVEMPCDDVELLAARRGDGKVVVATLSFAPGCFQPELLRFNPEGTPDTTFGTGGRTPISLFRMPDALAVEPEGKSLLASAWYLQRRLANGQLDSSFGRSGEVDFSKVRLATSFIHALHALGDGSALVAGTTSSCDSLGNNCLTSCTDCDVPLLSRLLADGSLDTSFGRSGFVSVTLPGDSVIRALHVQSDGKILAAGFTTRPMETDVFVARFLAQGGLDTSFNGSGVRSVRWSAVSPLEGLELVRQPDGKVVVLATRDADFGLLRLDGACNLDAALGTNGFVTTSVGGTDGAYALARQAEGRLVAAGYSYTPEGRPYPLLLRYQDNGTLDETFGEAGVARPALGQRVNSLRWLDASRDGRLLGLGVWRQAGQKGRLVVGRFLQ
ncbi:MAG TPA: hypothetical protein VK458_17760 [Myxococcaceae bacterium]|nr:hypothetical protein [Myxococcaceae bacterium]